MTKVKKFLGMVMAALMCFALTPTAAFAAEGDVTLTIEDPVENHTYQVYQMLTGNVTNLEATEADGAAGTVERPNRGVNLSADVTVNQFIDAVKGKSQSELGNEVYSYITGSPVAELTKINLTAEVAPGYYLVVDTGTVADGDAFSRFIVTVAGDTTITPKKDAPELEKTIVNTGANASPDNGKTNAAAIGDVVEYQLKSNVPNWEGYGQYKYIIHDELSKGLTLNASSIVFKIGGKTLVQGDDYIFAQNKQSFTLSIGNLKAIGVNVGEEITVTYSATVNDDAEFGYNANTNEAWLEYSNNPSHSGEGSPNPDNVTGETPKSKVETYVTALEITKFETVDGKAQALQGAEFTLTGQNLTKVLVKTEGVYVEAEDGEWYGLNDGTYTKDEPTDATASEYVTPYIKYNLTTVVSTESETAENSKVVGYVDEAGKLFFYGLNKGEYTLEETVVPDGYNAINPVEFEIKAEVKDGSFEWSVINKDKNHPVKIGQDGGIFTVNVENVMGLQLPSTGGMGTTILYIVGGVLVIGAIVFLVARRRSSAK